MRMVKSGSARLPDRPRLPTNQQILQDIATAKPDDVAFTSPVVEGSSLPSINVSSDGSYSEPHQADSHRHGPGGTSGVSIEDTFSQVLKLLEMEKELKQETSGALQEKYSSLERQGDDVAKSIADLKSTAETVLKKS